MALNFYTHAEITGILQEGNLDFQPFMSLNFSAQHITDEDRIYFDRIEADKRISVFQSARIPGVARTSKGYQTESFKPGYIKDKELILPSHVRTRRAGQPMSKPLNPAENYAATLVDKAALLITRFRRSLEIMATGLLLDDRYSMAGAGISPADATISFGRAENNTKTLTTTARWLDANKATVSPWDDLEDWINLPKSAPIKKIVMGNAAWRFLKNDTKYTSMVSLPSLYLPTMENNPYFQVATPKGMGGVTFRGTFLGTGIPIYTYTDTYIGLDGLETLYVPTDAVIGIPDAEYGFQCFASIEDANANYMGMEYFMRNWMSEDPANPQIMLQSAPLMAHTKIDSTFGVHTGAV